MIETVNEKTWTDPYNLNSHELDSICDVRDQLWMANEFMNDYTLELP